MNKKNIYEKKILFICHESSRTGAPIQLLTLLKWIKSSTDINFLILIIKGGDLDDEFKELAPTLILYSKLPDFFLSRFVKKIQNKVTAGIRLKHFVNRKISLIYSNTISNGSISLKLKEKYNLKVLTHVHELEGVIQSLGSKNISDVINATDHYLAASKAVKQNLIESHNIQREQISIHYESISIPMVKISSMDFKNIDLKLDGTEFIIGGSGFVDKRKGYDLFIETAEKVYLKNDSRNIRFVWIGGFGKGKKEEVDGAIKKYKLEDKVYFLGEKTNPFVYYQIFNLFFLASREDPFPLVLLENAYFKNPIICFSDGGGAIEFVEKDAGICIENFDTELAAEKILFLDENRNLLSIYGENAKAKLKEKYIIENNGNKFLEKIKAYNLSL